jgi:dTDP-4-dehydrorhamnose 3,5-epimerase
MEPHVTRMIADQNELGSSVTTLRVDRPQTLERSWSEAHELARRLAEPIFVPLTPFVDDRGWSLMNLLAGAMTEQGQINFSVQFPGVIKAWHRHHKQTDFWCCVHGQLKAGVYREDDGRAWMQVFGERRPGVLVIPPPLWHGAACVGPDPAGLLYYVTHAYDGNDPDEDRRAFDSVGGFPWRVRHG